MLRKFIRGCKLIVEIGVFEGFTTRMFAESCDPDAVIYGVDPFFTGRLGISWGLRIAKCYNRQHLSRGRVNFVRTLSIEVRQEVPTRIDFVFIDGDHSLQGITSDWAFWSSRTQSGGIIALHDTLLPVGRSKSFELGSHQYFASHIQHDERFEIVGQVDSLSVLRRR